MSLQSEPKPHQTELALSPAARPPSTLDGVDPAAESNETPIFRSEPFEPSPKSAERGAGASRISWLAFLGLFCVVLIGVVEYATGPEISFTLFYVPPVAMATWFGGRRLGLVAGFASALASFTARAPHDAQLSHLFTPSWNAATR